MDERIYSINQSTVTLRFGDIIKSKAEVIVSSDDGSISQGGGVSWAIAQAAGGIFRDDIKKLIPAKVGDVVVTSGGNLSAKYVLHAITLPPLGEPTRESDLPTGAVVRQTVRRVMEIVPLLNCHSVAFPAIGAGAAGVLFEKVAAEMAEVIVENLLDGRRSLAVEFCLHDRFGNRGKKFLLDLFERQLERTLGVRTMRSDDSYIIEAPTDSGGKLEPGKSPDPAKRQQEAFAMLRYLDQRRHRLESDLIASLGGDKLGAETTMPKLRMQLGEIRKLREIYEEELGLRRPRLLPRKGSVFVSSTYVDLKEHRMSLKKMIEGIPLQFLRMEEFVPSGQIPGEYIRDRVDESEIYLGVLGVRYGSIEPNSGLSMTELEYRQAVSSGKPRLMFVLDNHAPTTVDMFESDMASFGKWKEFRTSVLTNNVCSRFLALDDLTTKAENALRAHRARLPA